MLPPKIANGNIWLGLPVFCSILIPHLFLGALLFSICILVLGDILWACLQAILHRADGVYFSKLFRLKPPMPSYCTQNAFQSPSAVLVASLQRACLTLYSLGFLLSSPLLASYC